MREYIFRGYAFLLRTAASCYLRTLQRCFIARENFAAKWSAAQCGGASEEKALNAAGERNELETVVRVCISMLRSAGLDAAVFSFGKVAP